MKAKQPKMVVTSETPRPPKRERGKWSIRCAPTAELLAALSKKQADTVKEIDRLEGEIKKSAERHKKLKDEKTEEIDDVRARQRVLAEEVEHGATSVVDCYRVREGDEWVYYRDKEGIRELYREPAADGPQQRICGKETAKPAYDASADGTVDELLARAMAFVAPPCELAEAAERKSDPWPWGELSWHSFVRARQLELRELLEAADPPPATEPHPEPEADPDPPADPVGLPPAGEPLTWTAAIGEYGREYVTGGEREGYTISRDPGTQTKAGKGGLLQIVYHSRAFPGAMVLRKLTGRHKKVEAAKQAAQLDNDTRLRFPGDPERGLLLDSTGRYQIVETKGVGVGLGTDCGTGPVRKWRAERVGGQDEQNTDLGEHDELAEAIAACQAAEG